VQDDLLYLEQCGQPVSHVGNTNQWFTEINKKSPEVVIVSHKENISKPWPLKKTIIRQMNLSAAF